MSFGIGFALGAALATLIYGLAYIEIRRDHRWQRDWRDRLLSNYREAVAQLWRGS